MDTNLVSTDPSQNPYAANAVTDQGVIANDPTASSPVAITDPNSNVSGGGLISTLEGWTSSAAAGVENVGSEAISAVESGASAAYSAGSTVVSNAVSGVENVASKTVGLATGALSSVTMDIVLIVAILGAALYFAGKGGGFKITGVV